ncbi:MAG: 50S ribosomal protein L11 methyltransferase [Desulfobacterales bacterium]|nr:50S ribosomal protein L11 methyltransferase [Desulfobacterales bacterium]
MKWVEAKVVIDYSLYQDMDTAVSLVSDVYYDIGLNGVSVESPEYDREADWARDAVPMPDHYAVIGYFSKNGRLADRCQHLEAALTRLNEDNGIVTRVAYTDVDEEDWAESWKKFFYPKKISERFVIKPTWREYQPNPGESILEIDPGMAFGTGTHPTTRLCIQLMEAYLKPGDTFFDVGTGSGILMLAAQRLGAGQMVGTDKDEDAVAVALENLAQNRIDPGTYTVKSGHLTAQTTGRFDFIAANILTEVILPLLPDIPPLLKGDGMFICSGIIGDKRQWVADEMSKQGMHIYEVRSEDDWIAFAAGLAQTPRG